MVMKNRNKWLFIGLGIAALAALFYRYYPWDKKRFDWRDSWTREAYGEASTQPYGTIALHRLLSLYFPGHNLRDIRKSPATELEVDAKGQSNYVFVGEALYLDSLSTKRLLDFVKAGNTALLSSKSIPFDLMFHLYYEECEEAEWSDYAIYEDSIVGVSLDAFPSGRAVSLHYSKQNKIQQYQWSYIESDFFCDSLPQRPLGYLGDSLINFAEFPYGRGRFLLHTTPIAFSNYHLLRAGSRPYAEGVLSFLKEGTVYWDAVSRVPEQVSRRRNLGRENARHLQAEHPLSFILKQPALAWAWYLAVALGALYLLFRARRRQRIIPVLAKNENSSYEFIRTIANLHFREKNYQNLCVQNMRLFLAQLRERYGLIAQLDPNTHQPRIDAAFLQRLAQVAEVPPEQVRDIFNQYAATVQFDPTEEMMVQLHLAIEAFLKRAK